MPDSHPGLQGVASRFGEADDLGFTINLFSFLLYQNENFCQ